MCVCVCVCEWVCVCLCACVCACLCVRGISVKKADGKIIVILLHSLTAS